MINRPILRYYGGKFLLAPWIISHFPRHSVYVEPYAGAASVLLRKPAEKIEVINDLDDEIVNLFETLRDNGFELRRRIALTPYSRTEYQNSIFPTTNNIEQARRTLIRSAMAFGANATEHTSGFRPIGIGDNGRNLAGFWGKFSEELESIVLRLKNVIVEHLPALECVDKFDSPETLFYLDPPYVPETRKVKNCYKIEMTIGDHEALAEKLKTIKGFAIISGYRCRLYDELYRDWRREDILSLDTAKESRTESIWISPRADREFEFELKNL